MQRLGSVLSLALGVGCASSQTTELELSKLRQELHQIRADLAETKQTVGQLSDRVTLLSARDARPGNALPPSAPPQLAALPVVRLEKKKAAKPAGGDTGALDDGSPPILIQVDGGGETLNVDHAVLAKPDPVLAAKPKATTEKADKREKVEYEAALAALREKAQPAEARRLFTAFVERYPSSELRDNVAYWLAECSYAEGQWVKAIEAFTAHVADRPQSAKVPDALLRTAEAWLKLQRPKEAGDVLRRLIKDYPSSAVRATADQRLAELGAT